MTSDTAARVRIERALGSRVLNLTPLGGGTAGDQVLRARLQDGSDAVVKISGAGRTPMLDVEGRMLVYLADHSDLPVPRVLAAEPDMLIMTFIASAGGLNPLGEQRAADLIAALHNVTAPQYGLEWDTVIGGLPQANGPTDDWREFFAQRRLQDMARLAQDAGQLDNATAKRIDLLCARIDRLITDPGPPALLHGDLWGGNVLAKGGDIAGFVDPAIYYGDAEIELAFSTLFHSFGDAFYDRYSQHRPIKPGFFEERRTLYNLYPLLVHVRLFGGSYLSQVKGALDRFGV